MNFYILVEGSSTEMKAYPQFIKNYHPEYTLVNDLEKITSNSYFMFSGHGMPALYRAIGPALEDIEAFNRKHVQKIEHFVVCLDTDYYGDEDETNYRIMQEIQKHMAENVDISVIMQTMCIESWFLGNEDAFPEEYGAEFEKYAAHYDVSKKDPEKMRPPSGETSIGSYSKRYLKKMLNESGRSYSVSRVRDVTTPSYIAALERRMDKTGHIHSYSYLRDFLKKL